MVGGDEVATGCCTWVLRKKDGIRSNLEYFDLLKSEGEGLVEIKIDPLHSFFVHEERIKASDQ